MDNFSKFPTTPISPARGGVTVTPSDATELPQISRALYIGQGGDVSVTLADGDVLVFEAVPSGSLLPIRAGTVRSTGTSASGILALW